MTLPIPNVPNLPGVPQLPGYLPTGATTLTLETLTGTQTLGNVAAYTSPANVESLAIQSITSALWQASQAPIQWGVFSQNGEALMIDASSVTAFDNQNEWQVSSFPVQAATTGQASGFSSFNKVTVPYETMVTLRKVGNDVARSAFLQQIQAIAGDTNIYLIMTPEANFYGNITRYSSPRRGAEAAATMEVDLYFIAINQVASVYSNTSIADTSNAADPTALPTTNNGRLQPSVLSPQTQAALTALSPSLN